MRVLLTGRSIWDGFASPGRTNLVKTTVIYSIIFLSIGKTGLIFPILVVRWCGQLIVLEIYDFAV